VATTNAGEAVTIDVAANDTPAGLGVDAITTPPSAGTAVIVSNRVRYTPNSTDTFGYRVCDDYGRCASSTVAVRVLSPNRPPVAVDDEARTNPGGRVMIDVLANDFDPDGDLAPSTLTIVTPPSAGSATVTGGGKVRYAAPAGFSGAATFVYRVCDATGLCDTATVTVIVAR
jgi:hypothetical protein